MNDEISERRDRLTTGLVGGSLAIALAFVVTAYAWSWPLKVVANALQLLGIALTAAGVVVVRSWLQRAADTATAAKHGLKRWSAIRRAELRRWWDGRRGRPHQTIEGSGIPSAEAWGASTVTVAQRPRVDRDTISERAWLAHLDDRVESIFQFMDQAEQDRRAERGAVQQLLGAQRNELRVEIQRETRQGWELIVAGLAWSAIGTAVGILG